MIRRTLLVLLATAVVAIPAAAQPPSGDAGLVAWLQSYDRAFVSKDLDRLSLFYHPDVTIFEGGGINNGWADYRDHHIGPEMRGFEDLRFEHRNAAVHVLEGGASAYVTSEYALKARVAGKDVDTGGLETLVMVRIGGAWKIRHSHTSARRRAAPGGD